MTFLSRRIATALAGAILLAGAAPPLASPALAQSAAAKATVDQAKASGVVGEQADGFLGMVGAGGGPAVRGAVAEINAGRAQAYRDAAARAGVTAETAGQAAARQLEARLPPGQYFKGANGQWERR